MHPPRNTSFTRDLAHFLYFIRWPFSLLLLLWSIHLADVLWQLHLYEWGIFPRSVHELTGILTAPLIHGSWGHLASNSLPWLALTSMMLFFYPKVAWQVSIILWISTGFLVWLFARPSYHIGISGVIYGYISFLFWTGLFRRNRRAVLLSLIVLILYAGSVESIFPNTKEGISWESHLFGSIAGLILAFIFKNELEGAEIEELQSMHVSESGEKQYFLPRDTFEKTRLQRYYEQLEEELRLRQHDKSPD